MEYYELLKKIAETAERRDCLLMEWKEEFLEVLPQIQEECGHWKGLVDEDGNVMLGRFFYKLMDWKYYNKKAIFDDERVPVPFHCYSITRDDVLFTKKELEWDDEKKQYSGIYAETMRNISLKLTHPELYKNEEPNQSVSSKSGCATIIIAIIIIAITALI